MSYKMTVKIEEKQGQVWVEKWSDIVECSDARLGVNSVIHNGNKESRRYEISIDCSQIPG